MKARRRRSFVLVATLVAIVLVSLAAMGIALVADVDAQSVHADGRRLQARACAWSGVQCVMVELARQRDELLESQAPRTAGEWVLFESDDEPPERAVARLVEVEGALLRSETARLDVNHASPERLAALLDDAEAAEALVGARGAGFFASTEEARAVIAPREGDAASDPSNAEPRPAGVARVGAELLTVFSADPNVQIGLGAGGGSARGRARIDVSAPWSEDLHAAVIDRLGQEYGGAVSEHLRTRGPISSLGELASLLLAAQLPVGEWPVFFDAVSATPDVFRLGLIDLNTAEPAVLATVPGLDRDTADRIALRRRALDATLRRSIVWPLAEDLVTPEQFVKAADSLTARTMVWRFRIEAGLTSERAEPGRVAELGQRVVLEGVVDLAGPEPRLAYLRDITALEYVDAAAASVARAVEAEPAAETERPERVAAVVEAGPDPEPPPEPSEEPAEETSKPADTKRLAPARIGRWTAGAAAGPEATDDADSPGRHHPGR